MTQWEYCAVSSDGATSYWYRPDGNVRSLGGRAHVALTELGQQGWEAYAAFIKPGSGSGGIRYELRRPVGDR